MYPQVYLAIDNCLFYKRLTRPCEWVEKIAGLGLKFIEASADTELDPLYMGSEYLAEWVGQVMEAQDKYHVKVCNLYSGHGTYTTIGLTHTDKRVREHMINNWFFPMLEVAGNLGCGVGFFAHAFNHNVLQEKGLYEEYVEILTDGLVKINQYVEQTGCLSLGIEQMYTPHQYPWRLDDTENLIMQVTKCSGKDFYFTEDVGHHNTKFMRPQKGMLENGARGIWLGTDYAFELADRRGAEAWEQIETNMDANPHLFSKSRDGDCYETLRILGCYSPIIHLQQTNGTKSEHLPFTDEENRKGIIEGHKVLCSLKEAYDRPPKQGMPQKVNKVYLTLELFSGTNSVMYDILEDCRKSVEYWRRFIPKDGLRLDELVNYLEDF